jgi:hypothetical protein
MHAVTIALLVISFVADTGPVATSVTPTRRDRRTSTTPSQTKGSLPRQSAAPRSKTAGTRLHDDDPCARLSIPAIAGAWRRGPSRIASIHPTSPRVASAPHRAHIAADRVTVATRRRDTTTCLSKIGTDRGMPATDRSTPATDRSTPAPDRSSPAPDRSSPAPDRSSPAPDRSSPAPDRSSPAPDRNTPAPDRSMAPTDGSTRAKRHAPSLVPRADSTARFGTNARATRTAIRSVAQRPTPVAPVAASRAPQEGTRGNLRIPQSSSPSAKGNPSSTGTAIYSARSTGRHTARFSTTSRRCSAAAPSARPRPSASRRRAGRGSPPPQCARARPRATNRAVLAAQLRQVPDLFALTRAPR